MTQKTKAIRHLPYSYILLQQEYIFHIHILLSKKKTSSISIYSYPTRRHHIFFSNKKTSSITIQIFFSHKKTSPMSIQHIPCLHSRHMSLEHTHVSRAYIQSPQGPDMVKIQKIEDFDFFPGLKDDLWDIKYYHHCQFLRGLGPLTILILSSSKN